MTIEWKDDYLTNVDRIDEQHRQLFRCVNKLGRMVELGIVNGPEMDHMMMFLGSYTRVHFGYEEWCMRRNRCPAARANETSHREFLEFFDGIADEYRRTGGSSELMRRLHDTMGKWLVGHICTIDVKLKECIHSLSNKKATN